MSMKSFEESLAVYNAKVEEFKVQRAALAKQLQISFGEIVQDFFARNPEFEGILWNQYTPYFNDGDECIFRVNDFWGFYVAPDDTAYDEGIHSGNYPEDSVWVIGSASYNEPSNEAIETYGKRAQVIYGEYRQLVKVLESIGDEIYREAFGDHVQITVTRDGVDVQEYEHE